MSGALARQSKLPHNRVVKDAKRSQHQEFFRALLV